MSNSNPCRSPVNLGIVKLINNDNNYSNGWWLYTHLFPLITFKKGKSIFCKLDQYQLYRNCILRCIFYTCYDLSFREHAFPENVRIGGGCIDKNSNDLLAQSIHIVHFHYFIRIKLRNILLKHLSSIFPVICPKSLIRKVIKPFAEK